MRTSELLHFAFRARDPLALGKWYADVFDGVFLVHPVMCPLGIVLVKLNHPEAVFDGLLEFWPWDLVWDGVTASFRRIESKPTSTSYGHVAVKVAMDSDAICRELEKRKIAYRIEPRATGYMIPVVDDPEGNMVELFPNIDHIEMPPEAFCPPQAIDQALAAVKQHFDRRMAEVKPTNGVPLLLFK